MKDELEMAPLRSFSAENWAAAESTAKAFSEENWAAAESTAKGERGGRTSETLAPDSGRSGQPRADPMGATPWVRSPKKEHKWAPRLSRSRARRELLNISAGSVTTTPGASTSSASGVKRNIRGEEVGNVPLVSPRTQLAEDLTRTRL